MREKLGTWIVIVVVAWMGSPSNAQVQQPNDQGGFSPERAYQVGEVDAVDLYSGNLTLSVPLGIRFPVGPGLDYGFTLVYSSALWGFFEVEGEIDPDLLRTQGAPFVFNAGLGWNLSFGRLVNGTQDLAPEFNLYFSPDGGMHRFFPTLHDGDPVTPGFAYTRDGTYLRLQNLAGGQRLLEFPSGQRHVFDAAGELVRIETQYPSVYMTIARGSCPGDAGATCWTVRDSHSRKHVVTLRNGRVETIETGIDVNTNDAFSTFHLVYGAPTSITRSCPANVTEDREVTVTFLERIDLPDGSKYDPGNYVTNTPWFTPNDPECLKSGLITRLGMPTGGSIEWTWDRWDFPTGQTQPPPSPGPGVGGFTAIQFSAGVASRTLRDHDGSLLGCGSGAPAACGRWRYDNFGSFGQHDTRTEVTDPLGNLTKHYFTSAPGLDQGLPFSRDRQNGGRFLSKEEYRGTAELLRTTYVAYDHDGVGTLPTDLLSNTNRRLQRTITFFHEPNSPEGFWRASDSSGWDELGHYQTTTTTGSFAGDTRTTTTAYNPSRQTPPATARWLLETYGSREVTEGTGTFVQQTCFTRGILSRVRTIRDTETPIVVHGQDLAIDYELSSSTGEVLRERRYGADPGGVPTSGDFCSADLGIARSHVVHQYQHGVRSRSFHDGFGWNLLNVTVDRWTGLVTSSRDSANVATTYDHDPLGRVVLTRPGDDAWVSLAYRPPGPGRPYPQVVHKRYASGGLFHALTDQEIDYDGFGRIRRDRTRRGSAWDEVHHAHDTLGNRTYRSERVPQGYANHKGTRWLDFDPFGRPGRIQTADGKETTLGYLGERQTTRTVRVLVGASEANAPTVERFDNHGRLRQVIDPVGLTATYGYDAMDHLVTAELTGGGTTQLRRFGYDGLGFLRWESHPEKDSNGVDPGGYPAGLYANGSDVDYLDYDVFGHARRTVDGPNELVHAFDGAGRPTATTWTKGDPGFMAPRPLLAYTYGHSISATHATGLSNGKLIQARRHNYGKNGESIVDVQITYNYAYQGRSGRLSKRELAHGYIADIQSVYYPSPGASFVQSWTYDDLGNVGSTSYPQCTFSPCDASQTAYFTDVPVGHPYKPDIEAILFAGITSGCAPASYCPNNTVTRAEMAVFLIRAASGPAYTPPACTTQLFSDVPCHAWYAPYANELLRRGITVGCGNGNFCPDATVTRAELAVFLMRTRHGDHYLPQACTSTGWSDVPGNHWAACWIKEATAQRVMQGVTSTEFRPAHTPTRAEMARILTRTFDIVTAPTPASPRVVRNLYQDGLLTTVSGYAALSYHPNGLVSEVRTSAGDSWYQDLDATHRMPRPSEIRTSFGVGLKYAYDGAGNVTQVGNQTFSYDHASRIVALRDNGVLRQSYSYDRFGNLRSMLPGRSIDALSTTNRLASGVYDSAGNLRAWGGVQYEYDPLDLLRRTVNGAEDWQFVYDADGERVFSVRLQGEVPPFYRWTLRDLDNRVLRTWEVHDWSWGGPVSDSVWREDRLLATEDYAAGKRRWHFPDHLGSPRITLDDGTRAVTEHHYFPFGEEISPSSDTERHKFTGHERDALGTGAPDDDLDYMHARFYNPRHGRFLSIDKVPGRPAQPQSWNRYAYVRGNPLTLVDPDGTTDVGALASEVVRRLPSILETGSNLLSGFLDRTASIASPAGPVEPTGNVDSVDYRLGGGAAELARNELVVNAGATVDVSGASRAGTGGLAVTSGGDVYLYAGGGFSVSASPLSLEYGVSAIDGKGSLSGPSVAASVAPLGPTVGRSLSGGPNTNGVAVSTDLGVSGFFQIWIPLTPKEPK